jgi:hypothetical protein
MDVTGIILCLAVPLARSLDKAFNSGKVSPRSKRLWFWLFFAAVILAATFFYSLDISRDPLKMIIYAEGFGLVGLCIITAFQRSAFDPYEFAAVVVFLVALLVFQGEGYEALAYLQFRSEFSHGIWHVLTGLMFWLIYRFMENDPR